MIRGYARCSTRDQSYEGQIEALRAAGAEQIYAEKESGAKSDRAELARAIADLQPADVLMVKCIDRLARSTLDLLTLIERVSKAGAGFRSLQEAWLDTSSPSGMMILTVLGGVAQFERSIIL
jgi:DNA invertase Pin-like site-specific DNA recombinase